MAKFYGPHGGGMVRCYLDRYAGTGEMPFYVRPDQILGIMRDGGTASEKVRIALSEHVMSALGLRKTHDFYTFTTNLPQEWRMYDGAVLQFIRPRKPEVGA